jgi:transcriptional regulator GlxA family with amidase domain
VDNGVDQRIEYSRYLIEQRLAERVRMGEIAALVGLSPSRFANLFRHVVGTSPLRYLRQLRIERARALLEETSLPIKDVMRQVGCTDKSHFSKDFRSRFGVGARQYRAAFRRSSRTKVAAGE